jgi:AraC-like DNA-binding protein
MQSQESEISAAQGDPRFQILALLDKLLRAPLTGVTFAHAGIPPVENPLFVEWPRLNVVLSGKMAVALPLASGPKAVALGKGEAFFAQANAWERIDWGGRFELLCIVPRVRYLRVSYYDHRSVRKSAGQPGPVYHHTDRPYGEALRLMLEVMAALLTSGDEALVKELSGPFIRLARSELARIPDGAGSKAKQTFDRIQTWLENSFHEPVSRENTAARFGVSPAYLSRLFSAMTGLAFHEYLTKLRLDRAKTLLAKTELAVKQVGRQCGYDDPVHFVRRFREIHGISPGRFRVRANA